MNWHGVTAHVAGGFHHIVCRTFDYRSPKEVAGADNAKGACEMCAMLDLQYHSLSILQVAC